MKYSTILAVIALISVNFFTAAPAAAEQGPSELLVAQAGEAGPGEEITAQISMMARLKATKKTGFCLLIVSVLSLTFALERLFNLRRGAIVPGGLANRARELWSEGQYDGLLALCRKKSSTLGRVIEALIIHRNSSMADVSRLAGDIAGQEMKMHLQRAYPIAVAATISPLLGLFGTVYGMIGAFEAVALAGKMGDPSIMAEDISFALMTTAIGLAIAIPSLAAYHFFRTRTNVLTLALERESNDLISEWFLTEEV